MSKTLGRMMNQWTIMLLRGNREDLVKNFYKGSIGIKEKCV